MYDKLNKIIGNEYKSIDDIALEMSEKKDAVMRLIFELREKGFVEVKKESYNYYCLGKFGKIYIKEKFPEELLAEIDVISFHDFNKKFGKKSAFLLGYARKKGYITISLSQDGQLIKLSKKIDLHKFRKYRRLLKKLKNDCYSLTEEEIAFLKTYPKLIEEHKKHRYYVKKIKDFEIEKGSSVLTKKMIKEGKADLKPYNVLAGTKELLAGKKHPYAVFLDLIKEKMLSLGFKEMPASLVTSEFFNFDVLYQPQNHPARTWTDTYSLATEKKAKLNKELIYKVKKVHEEGLKGYKGWGYIWNEDIAMKLMPAAQGTAASAKKMALGVEEGKYFALARVFRPDVVDATHLCEFNQLEGFVVGKNLSFKNLLYMLDSFAKEIAGAEETMFFPDYYPFTEPSVQLSAKHPKLGWVEFGGAGIFRREITETLGIKGNVIAWGLGIDRLAMFKIGIKDIRELFSQNIDFLRKAKLMTKL